MSERDGQLTVDGDRAVLNFERRLPFPVEVVWSAITDPHERAQWFGETTIEAREGGTIDMVATGPPLPPERKRMTGRILVWDPPHVLDPKPPHVNETPVFGRRQRRSDRQKPPASSRPRGEGRCLRPGSPPDRARRSHWRGGPNGRAPGTRGLQYCPQGTWQRSGGWQ